MFIVVKQCLMFLSQYNLLEIKSTLFPSRQYLSVKICSSSEKNRNNGGKIEKNFLLSLFAHRPRDLFTPVSYPVIFVWLLFPFVYWLNLFSLFSFFFFDLPQRILIH